MWPSGLFRRGPQGQATLNWGKDAEMERDPIPSETNLKTKLKIVKKRVKIFFFKRGRKRAWGGEAEGGSLRILDRLRIQQSP